MPFSFVKSQKSRVKSCASGFTVIEMLVAVGIFSIIMVVTVGSFLTILQANYKAQSLKTVLNNLHFALENMSRNLRTGSVYHCDVGVGVVDEPQDCASTPAASIAFASRDGSRVRYRHQGKAIERAIIRAEDGGAVTYIPITAPELEVEQLQFFVDGSNDADSRQPRVLILMSGSMKGKGKVVSRFDIESLVSQRLLDIRR
ncbi:MAG: type II secretion system protein [bacterium]|nr:type II secretion system protein [bacterium]